MKIQCKTDHEFLEMMYFLYQVQPTMKRLGMQTSYANREGKSIEVETETISDAAFLDELKNLK